MESNSTVIPLDWRLHDAAKTGNISLLEKLLNPGPNNSPDCLLGVTHGRDTALHIAARFGHLQVARKICHKKVSLLMERNAKLETPLHYAAKAGRHKLVTLFIQFANEASNINLPELLRTRNRDGETALYQAVLYNHLAVVRKFMHAVLPSLISELVSLSNNKNISPLYLAIMHGQHAIVTSLIRSLRENGSLESSYAGPDGQTALHAAAQSPGGFVQGLLSLKSELATSKDISGSTPLHYAASSGNLEAVIAILKENVTCAYMADNSRLYPVHLAVKMGFVGVVTRLFELCPDLGELVDEKGRNFVHHAVKEQREGIVSWICRQTELAEAMNAQDNNGDTAMHLAVKAGHINIFARLLGTKKANLYLTNNEGLTPRELAISKATDGFVYWKNPNIMMIRTLNMIRPCRGIKRRDHFVSEYYRQIDHKKEKIVEDFESLAKSMAIGSVLIASAAFVGAFTVSEAYKSDIFNGHKSRGLITAFWAFILMVVYAFVCSITATCLLIQAALIFLDPTYRMRYIMISITLIRMATMGFVASFAIGLYVVLTPMSKGLAVLVCLAGVFVPVLIQPHLYPNYLVIKALLRYIGWTASLVGSISAFWDNIYCGLFVLAVLLGSIGGRAFFIPIKISLFGYAITISTHATILMVVVEYGFIIIFSSVMQLMREYAAHRGITSQIVTFYPRGYSTFTINKRSLSV